MKDRELYSVEDARFLLGGIAPSERRAVGRRRAVQMALPLEPPTARRGRPRTVIR